MLERLGTSVLRDQTEGCPESQVAQQEEPQPDITNGPGSDPDPDTLMKGDLFIIPELSWISVFVLHMIQLFDTMIINLIQ